MIKMIRKRDGRFVEFDVDKIANAINKSFIATNSQYDIIMAKKLALDVYDRLEEMQTSLPTVELVQDTVEEILIENGLSRVAKAYIIYRVERTKKRNMNSNLMKSYESMNKQTEINVLEDHRPLDALYHYGIQGARNYNEMFILEPDVLLAHEKHEIHINHLEFSTITVNNAHYDFNLLLDRGLIRGEHSKRLSDFNSVIYNIISLVQYDIYGEQLIMNLDYFMARAINSDFKTNFAYFLQIALELSTNMNYISSFIDTVTKYDLLPTLDNRTISDDLYRFFHNYGVTNKGTIDRLINFAFSKAEEKIKIDVKHVLKRLLESLYIRNYFENGEPAVSYGLDKSKAGRMFTKTMIRLNQENPGFRKKIKNILVINKDNYQELINWIKEDPKGYYIQNCDVNSNIIHTDATVYQLSQGGNIGKVTINLPHLAIESKKDLAVFFDSLDHSLELAKKALMQKYNLLASKKKEDFDLVMKIGAFSNGVVYDSLKEILDTGTLVIDFFGLMECIEYLDSGNMQLRDEILRFMAEKVSEPSVPEIKLAGGYEVSVASYISQLDMEQYGIIEGVTDTKYAVDKLSNRITAIEDMKKVLVGKPITESGLKFFVECDHVDLKELVEKMPEYNCAFVELV